MADTPTPAYEPPDPERPATAEPTLPILTYEAQQRHDPYAAFRVQSYRTYSLGWLCAAVGFQMQSAAIGWEIFQWTGSALKMGLAGGIQALPLILLALPAGHLADLYDRRRIVILGAISAALCSLSLAALSWAWSQKMIDTPRALHLMYWIIFAGGVFSTFSRPARGALLPQIVPQPLFTNAVTWNSTIFEVSAMSGPALAGLVLWLSGPVAVYALATACSFAFLFFLLIMRYAPPPRTTAAPGTGIADLMAGLRFVFHTRVILATITLDLFAVLLGGATYLLPQFAEQILHVGPVGFGWLRASPAIGAFSMAIYLAHRPPIRRAGRAMLLAVAGFGAATIVFGLSRNFWLSLAALVVTGALDNISVVIRHTLVQLLTPDQMRGRVSAVNAVFIGASNELGGFESGVTAHWFGPIISVVGGGIGTILVVCGVAIGWPQVRRLGSLRDLRPEGNGARPSLANF